MDDLLGLVLTAHGGLERWNELNHLRVHASITGATWSLKGKPDVLREVDIQVDTHQERVITEFPGKNKRSIFEPQRIVLETEDFRQIDIRDNPKSSFAGHTIETPWDDIHVAYFSGEALWTYFTFPFLLTSTGIVTEELTPWQENGEQWRRLQIQYPESIVTHNRLAIAYFDGNGLLRRYDYSVDILGAGNMAANYPSDYQIVDGIAVPMKRRVYRRDANQFPIPHPVLIAIDLSEMSFGK
jgi:hypothetical protein